MGTNVPTNSSRPDMGREHGLEINPRRNRRPSGLPALLLPFSPTQLPDRRPRPGVIVPME